MSEERADWRPSPISERELAEDRRHERRRKRNLALLVASSLGACPLSCIGTCASFESPGANEGFLVFGLASIGLFVYAIVRYGLDKENARQRRLDWRQEFSGVGGWLVELSIYQGEAVSGRDLGIVWFEEDRLYFTGARTSFGLASGDAEGRLFEGSATLEAGSQVMLPLRARTGVGPVAIALRFTATEPELSALVGESDFRHALRGWLARGGEGAGQLPPLLPGPDLPSSQALTLRAVAATAAGPGLVLLAALAGLWGGGPLAATLFLAGLLLLLWPPARSPRRCWRAVRDRRRLEAYNRGQ